VAAVRCHPCAALLRAFLVAVRQKRRPQAQGHSFPARSCIAPARPSEADGDRGNSSGQQLPTAAGDADPLCRRRNVWRECGWKSDHRNEGEKLVSKVKNARNRGQSVSQLFHGPAPRSPLHRLAHTWRTEISTADRTHARTGPDTQRAQGLKHTTTRKTATHERTPDKPLSCLLSRSFIAFVQSSSGRKQGNLTSLAAPRLLACWLLPVVILTRAVNL
jgi:hypothetical protein